jgi:hypothetical protein
MAGENIENNDSPFGEFDLTAIGEFAELIDQENTEQTQNESNTEENSSNDDDGEFPFQLDEEEENEESKESDQKDKSGDPSSQETSEKDSKKFPLTPYAKLLVEEGVLQNFDIEKFDGSADSLIDAFKNQVSVHVEEYKNTLDPRIKWLQDNIEEGVPLEALLRLDKEKITFSSLSEKDLEENEDLQKNIVREYFRKTTTGWSDTRIEKEINRLADIGDLKAESKEFFEELKGLTAKEEEQMKVQAQKEQEEAIRKQKEILDTFKKKLEETKEIIPGTEVSKQVKETIYKVLTTPVGYDNFGMPMNAIAKARSENPIEFEMNLAYIFEVTKGFKDWSSLISTGKKKAIQEFEEAAARLDVNKGNSGYRDNTASSKKTDDILEGMRVFGRK